MMPIFNTLLSKRKAANNSAMPSIRDTLRVAKFEKVSYTQYREDALKLFPNSPESEIQKSYDNIIMPSRATAGSAGYDLHTPTSFVLQPGESIMFPTGLRCIMNLHWFLLVVPRSGMGCKYYTRLANTCGVIDADYCHANNEGHILVKLRREADAGDARQLIVNAGDAIAQCLLLPHGITHDDAAQGIRTGGLGSTRK